MPFPPVLVDSEIVRRRFAERERALVRELAELESAFQRFENVERPAYEQWKRLEFGPRFADLDELYERIRLRRLLALRVEELVDRDGLHPREALYVVESGSFEEAEAEESHGDRSRDHDADEIEARRRAKREAKRASRKEAKKERRRNRAAAGVEEPVNADRGSLRTRLVAVYRRIARQLHPDSPTAAQHLAPSRARELWHEVQAAYQAANLERLLAIAAWLAGTGADSAEEDAPSGSFAERNDRVRALEGACRRLEKKIEALRQHPAWAFEAAGGSARRKLAKRVAREIDAQFEQAQSLAAAIEDFFESIGPPRQPAASGAPGRRKRR